MAKRKVPEELPLFDLPLHPEASGQAEPTEPPARVELESEPVEQQALFPPSLADEPAEAPTETRQPVAETVTLGGRYLAGMIDLAVQVLMLAGAALTTLRMGIAITPDSWPAFGLLAAAFSFLYWMMPLAFWGQTPGMAWVGHQARSAGGEPLSFPQAFRRWLGAILTLALAGLPLLLSLRGRSLSDRLSGSKTGLGRVQGE